MSTYLMEHPLEAERLELKTRREGIGFDTPAGREFRSVFHRAGMLDVHVNMLPCSLIARSTDPLNQDTLLRYFLLLGQEMA